MIFSRILRILFLAVSFGGCFYHLLYVNNQYFAYKTTTRVESQLQDIVQFPTIVFCAKVLDVINNISLVSKGLSHNSVENLRIEEILDLTPAENETIAGCGFRNEAVNQFVFSQYRYEECYKYFGVKKSLTGELVCYQIYTIQSLKYSIHAVANAITHPLTVFNIELSASFTETTNIFLPAYYLEDSINTMAARQIFPIFSRQFGEILIRYKKDTWIIMRPFEEYYELLPLPFDTNCTRKHSCSRECVVNKTIERTKFYPFSEPATVSNGKIKMLFPFHFENQSYAKLWLKIRDECRTECPKIDCRVTITSNVAYRYTSYIPTNLSLTVSVPGMYRKKIVAVPLLSIIEYVSSLSTCISIWFGVSALSINPFKWMIRRNIKLNVGFKYARFIYYVICFSGFLWQFFSICDQYFKFQTRSQIQVVANDEYKYQTLGACFFYPDILNRSEHNKYGLLKTYQEAWITWPEEASKLIVNELYRLTPDNGTILKNCAFQDKINFHLVQHQPKDCYQFLSTQKVLRGEMMCYMFAPPENATFSWSKVSTSFYNKGQVYSLQLELNRPLDMLTIVISYQADELNPLPSLSRNFAQLVNLNLSNVILISSSLNTFNSLPAPYDTRCINGLNQDKCKGTCITKKLVSELNRLPSYFYITNEFQDLKTINADDIQNETVAFILSQIQQDCNSHCSYMPCYQIVSFTDSDNYYNSDDEGYLSIVSLVPQRPALHVSSIPSTSIPDFLLYMCNCFGIWFGLSFAVLDFFFIWNFFRKILLWVKHQFLMSLSIKSIKNMKSKHSFCWRIVLWSICLSGFALHCYTFCKTYFRYETISRIEISARDIYRLPNIILCTRYAELTSKLNHVDFNANLNSLTIKQILDMTPEPRSTIQGCKYGFNNSELFWYEKHDECMKIWTAMKYVLGADVCYAYVSNPMTVYSVAYVAAALNEVGIIYELHLNKSLSVIQHLRLISYTQPVGLSADSRRTLPLRSARFGETIFRDTDDLTRNYILIQGTLYNVTLLPAPYDTDCLPDIRADFCEGECNIQFQSENLERVPFHEMITEPTDLKMVSSQELMNETFRKITQEGNKRCGKKCNHRSCDSYFSLTDASGFLKPMVGNNLVLAAGVARTNGLIVNTFPSMQLIDFLNNLAISASIWFGVSVLSICMTPVTALFVWSTFGTKAKSHKRIHRKQRMERLHRRMKVTPRYYCRCAYCQRYSVA